jgi:hypothetical protein
MSFEDKERDFLLSAFVATCLVFFCVGKMRFDYLDAKVASLEATLAKMEEAQ